MPYITVPLTPEHDKKLFSCGKASLDNYIQKQAKQDMKRRLSVVFVLPEEGSGRIKGYYSLSNDNVPLDDAPSDIKKKIPPNYSDLPVTLLGRLAVDTKFQGQKLGEQLLIDALKRSYDISETAIGSIAVVVDPLDEHAIAFYQYYGFILIPDRGRLFLPMKTIRTLFS